MASGFLSEFRDFISSIVTFPADFLGGFGMPPSASGAIVNEFSAIQIPAYFACIRVIADAVGTLPLNVYERLDDGSEVLAPNHFLFDLLHTQPNPEVPAADQRQAGQTHILMNGNCYIEIIRDLAGRPAQLYLRSPFTTFPYRNAKGELIYKLHDDPSGAERTIEAYNMIHVKGLGIDSLVGLSPVKYYAREILGIEIAAQAYGAKYFANGASASGILKTPAPNMKPAQKMQALNSWMQAHSKGNAHMPAVLEKGWEWQATSDDPLKAQLILLRGLNRSQIGAIFGVPEHMIGGAEETKATIEQKALEFLTFTLKPWLRKWEQAINSKLFPKVGRNANRFFCKFDTKSLEQADFKSKMAGLQMLRYSGGISANEMRAEVGMNPYSEKQLTSKNPADRVLNPVNMVFVGEESLDTQEQPPSPGSDTESEAENPVTSASDKPKGTKVSEINSEIKHYIRTYAAVFTDAFNRIQARKKPDAKDFKSVFSPVLNSIAAAMTFDSSAEPGQMELHSDMVLVVNEFIDGMQHRSKDWKNDLATASAELKRAVEFLHGKAEAFGKVFEVEDSDE